MENHYLIGIIILLFIVILFICNSSRSTFGSDATSSLPTISKDTTLIFHAPWCGYCIESMSYFKEAVARGDGDIVLIDSTDDLNKDLVKKYGIVGFPTIIKGNVKYSGDRKDIDGIVKFSKS
jgi:thiol-disulfide isomerase/thioredoxin